MIRRVSALVFLCLFIFSLSFYAFAEDSASAPTVVTTEPDPGSSVSDHVYSNDYDTVCNVCGSIRRFVEQFDFVNSHLVLIDNDSTHLNPRVVIYTLGDIVYTGDPADENALLQLDPNPVTKWGFSEIDKITLTNPGNYIVHYKYNIEKNVVREPLVISLFDSDPEPDPISLVRINENISVIQSLLWVIVVFLVCFVFWKFFRWFF